MRNKMYQEYIEMRHRRDQAKVLHESQAPRTRSE